jgi:hypothetical protein
VSCSPGQGHARMPCCYRTCCCTTQQQQQPAAERLCSHVHIRQRCCTFAVLKHPMPIVARLCAEWAPIVGADIWAP